MKIYTQPYPKPNQPNSSIAIPLQSPRQSTIDAIMAFASQCNYLKKT